MENMEWTNNRSIRLSRWLLYFFAAVVLAMDLGGLWLCRWMVGLVAHGSVAALMVCLYGCSIPAYILIWDMLRLLRNLQRELVFTAENTGFLRTVSYCCFAAGLVCLVGSMWFPMLLAITAAAGFVGLIVRIVKNVFQQAIAMKDELDYTV